MGLTDRAIQESRERVRAAVRNSGFDFPQKRLTVNLAPAEVHKEGTCFDLAIALAVLGAGIEGLPLAGVGFLGELTLDGGVRSVAGILPMARCLRDAGVRRLAVAVENGPEAALVTGLEVTAVPSLRACVEHLLGTAPLPPALPSASVAAAAPPVDLAQVRGQALAKRALEVAAAGGHNLLMLGPPGSGKTMLARAFASILPDLPLETSLEVAAVYSLRGALDERPATSPRPPFRAPHHSISRAGLIGGGMGLARPGEISLAHHGVLFLDEICEFPRGHLEALRQPLEEHSVSIARSRGSVLLPAGFTLVAAGNPCPCGHLGDVAPGCSCDPRRLEWYRARLSGPLRDRIDLVINVPRQPYAALFDQAGGEASRAVRARVEAARRHRAEQQGTRFPAGSGAASGGRQAVAIPDSLTAPAGRAEVAECRPSVEALRLLASAGERLHLSARAFFRVLRVARTIANLSREDQVGGEAVAEALRYRSEAAA